MQGTVCVWSCLFTLTTGAQDPRLIEETFDNFAFPCHTDSMDPPMNMIVAFSEITNVSNGGGTLLNQFKCFIV